MSINDSNLNSSNEAVSERPSLIKQTRLYYHKPQIEYLRFQSGIHGNSLDKLRIQAFTHILDIAKLIKFPVKTISTAMNLFQRSILFNKIGSVHDLVVACILVASKIEDTPKKSIELLRASYQVRGLGWVSEDTPRKRSVLGQERLLLETVGFDFRFRHSHEYIIPICKSEGEEKIPKHVGKTAWAISLDSHLSDVILQYPPHAVAFACIVLAAKVEQVNIFPISQHTYNIPDRKIVTGILVELVDMYLRIISSTELGATWQKTAQLHEWRDQFGKEIRNEPLTDRLAKGVKPRDYKFDPKGTIRYVLDWELDHVNGELVT